MITSTEIFLLKRSLYVGAIILPLLSPSLRLSGSLSLSHNHWLYMALHRATFSQTELPIHVGHNISGARSGQELRVHIPRSETGIIATSQLAFLQSNGQMRPTKSISRHHYFQQGIIWNTHKATVIR